MAPKRRKIFFKIPSALELRSHKKFHDNILLFGTCKHRITCLQSTNGIQYMSSLHYIIGKRNYLEHEPFSKIQGRISLTPRCRYLMFSLGSILRLPWIKRSLFLPMSSDGASYTSFRFRLAWKLTFGIDSCNWSTSSVLLILLHLHVLGFLSHRPHLTVSLVLVVEMVQLRGWNYNLKPSLLQTKLFLLRNHSWWRQVFFGHCCPTLVSFDFVL